jgi:hypothetical protein
LSGRKEENEMVMLENFGIFVRETVVQWGVWKYFLTTFVLWYLCFYAENFMTGRVFYRNRFAGPFHLFWDELLWHLPGGMDRQIEYLKKNIITGKNWVCVGSRKIWTLHEVMGRGRGWYRECAKDILPGKIHLLSIILVPPTAVFFVALLWTSLQER